MIRSSTALPRLGRRIVYSPTYAARNSRHRAQALRYESSTARAQPNAQAQADKQQTELNMQTPPIPTSITPPKPQPSFPNPTSSPPPSTEAQKSIPGPTWLWLEPFRAYGRVHQRRPLMTQFISALVIYLVGDFVAQGIGGAGADDKADTILQDTEKEEAGWLNEWAQNRDWNRTGRALLIGGIAAVPGYKWFLWLSNNFNYRSKIGSLALKVVINQSFFTPIFNTYFFGMQHILSNPSSAISLSSLATHIQNTVPQSVYNSCKVWPAVTAFSFAFVPLEYRSLVAGVVAIGWQTYLSILDQRAKRKERERREAGGDIPAAVHKARERDDRQLELAERTECAA